MLTKVPSQGTIADRLVKNVVIYYIYDIHLPADYLAHVFCKILRWYMAQTLQTGLQAPHPRLSIAWQGISCSAWVDHQPPQSLLV